MTKSQAPPMTNRASRVESAVSQFTISGAGKPELKRGGTDWELVIGDSLVIGAWSLVIRGGRGPDITIDVSSWRLQGLRD